MKYVRGLAQAKNPFVEDLIWVINQAAILFTKTGGRVNIEKDMKKY